MTTPTYRRALKEAEKNLLRLTSEREALDLAIIRTRQTVLTLRMQVDGDAGYSTANPKTLTEAVEWILIGSKVPLEAPKIRDRVVALPFDIKSSNPLASIYSVLKRLNEQGLSKVAYKVGSDGKSLLWYSRSFWSGRIHKLPDGWVLPSPEEVDRQWDAHTASFEEADGEKVKKKGSAKK